MMERAKQHQKESVDKIQEQYAISNNADNTTLTCLETKLNSMVLNVLKRHAMVKNDAFVF